MKDHSKCAGGLPSKAATALPLSFNIIPQANRFAIQEGLSHAALKMSNLHSGRFLIERQK